MTSGDMWLTFWKNEPENCWSYATISKGANWSPWHHPASSSMGLTRPFIFLSPSKMATPNRHIGSNSSLMNKSLLSPKDTPLTRSLLWDTYMLKPSLIKIKSPLCHSQSECTMSLLDPLEDAFPSFHMPISTFHGELPQIFDGIDKPIRILLPSSFRLPPFKLRYTAAKRYKQELGAGWRWHMWRKS